MRDARPLLIYDGDCAFCLYWVRWWRALTGDAVRYEPYQVVGPQHPSIAPEAFARAVQYVATDGHICSGAQASFRALAYARGRGIWLALYRYLPGFAWLAECIYALIAAHRPAALRVSIWLWGREPRPPRFERTAAWLVGGLALVYLAAFASMGVQITGLVGPRGILPLTDYLAAAAQRYPGAQHFWLFPTVFWLDAGNAALRAVCLVGMFAALLLLVRRAPRICLATLFVLYLSLFYAGQVFMSFQWDLLLLEAGFIALVLQRHPFLLVWVMRWLVFRFMFMSGLVKLLGDPGWLDFSALRDYFQTQPLPAPGAWVAARAPHALLAAATAATLLIELVLPFFVFLPRRPRMAAAWAFIGLQVAILLTGNYGFFNPLAIVLTLALFDDAALGAPRPGQHPLAALHVPARPPHPALALAFAAFSVMFGALQVRQTWRSPGNAPVLDDGRAARWLQALEPLRIVNRYGPFKAMTRERPEIVIEASADGVHWQELEFRFKPGDPRRAPIWNVPHQPRLDWQMWFAAQGTQHENPWFSGLMLGLLRNTPEVAGLLAEPPLEGAAPKQLRAQLYDYRFADAAARASGAWWTRRPLGLYFPAVELGRGDDGSYKLVPAAPAETVTHADHSR